MNEEQRRRAVDLLLSRFVERSPDGILCAEAPTINGPTKVPLTLMPLTCCAPLEGGGGTVVIQHKSFNSAATKRKKLLIGRMSLLGSDSAFTFRFGVRQILDTSRHIRHLKKRRCLSAGGRRVNVRSWWSLPSALRCQNGAYQSNYEIGPHLPLVFS